MQTPLTTTSLFDDLLATALTLPDGWQNGQLLSATTSRELARDRILSLQAAAEQAVAAGSAPACCLDDVFPLTHSFAPGLYSRQMKLPAGHWIIGKIHKHAHHNNISSGKVVVFTEEGIRVFFAPYSFVSEPYTKRVVLVIEDTLWTTYHPTDKTDVAEIEADIIAPNFIGLPCAAGKELL